MTLRDKALLLRAYEKVIEDLVSLTAAEDEFMNGVLDTLESRYTCLRRPQGSQDSEPKPTGSSGGSK